MNNRSRIILSIGFISGGLAVVSGAFGAHYLRNILVESGHLETYKTAVHYHIIHSVLLVIAGILYHFFPSRKILTIAVLLVAGILLFSGSLYALSLTGNRFLGMITPFGGIALIFAWGLLAWNFTGKNKNI